MTTSLKIKVCKFKLENFIVYDWLNLNLISIFIFEVSSGAFFFLLLVVEFPAELSHLSIGRFLFFSSFNFFFFFSVNTKAVIYLHCVRTEKGGQKSRVKIKKKKKEVKGGKRERFWRLRGVSQQHCLHKNRFIICRA